MNNSITEKMLEKRDHSRFWNTKMPEYAVFVLFIILYCVITAFHEPWFDEAQAWQIGKCASMYDLLFEVPHYEGHPAFWYLLMAIPAKLGAPFEPSLKLIGLLFSSASVWLILFKMKYPRIMRLVLPFTYFIFYQYGVIVRPYCVLILTFLLLAFVFPERHKKPWRFVGLLALLCLTGAYGIVMAGGIAICYLWELLEEKGIGRLFLELFSDRRTLSLCLLLILAILLLLQIMPRQDTLITSANGTNSFFKCLLIALFTFIGECTFTTGSWFTVDTNLLQFADTNNAELAAYVLLGIVLWILLIGVSSKKLLKYFIVPFMMLSIFASLIYFHVHHIGVIYALLLFWMGIIFQDENKFEIGKDWIQKFAKTERDKKLLINSTIIIGMACLIIPVYWTIGASVNDIKSEYCYGRNTANWIIEHRLENCKLFCNWGWGTEATTLDDFNPKEDLYYNNVNMVDAIPVVVSAYLNHNICMNLNYGHDNEAYMHHRIATWDEIESAKVKWKEEGIPELVTGINRIPEVYGDLISEDDYSPVYIITSNRIWKNNNGKEFSPLYARNDIIEEHGLEPIGERLEWWINGLVITDEMREQYENGVPVEEILKPYLDEMFGEEK